MQSRTITVTQTHYRRQRLWSYDLTALYKSIIIIITVITIITIIITIIIIIINTASVSVTIRTNTSPAACDFQRLWGPFV